MFKRSLWHFLKIFVFILCVQVCAFFWAAFMELLNM